MKELYTIGHSNHSFANFLELLKRHNINALCDVRSHPYSKSHPHFNYKVLQQELPKNNLAYVFLGNELGGRTNDVTCYNPEGQIQYDRLAHTPLFQAGLQRLQKGIERSYKIALMCAEKEPLFCHRMVLIGRQLRSTELTIKHILEDGRIETQPEAEQRLIHLLNLPAPDLITDVEQLIEVSYRTQSQTIAYVTPHLKTLVVHEEKNHYEPHPTLHHRLYSENCRTIF